MARKRLGELLMERGLIDGDQLNSALAHQRQWGVRLGSALVTKGFIREGSLTRILSESLQIPMVDLAKIIVDKKSLGLIRASVAEEMEIFPIAVKEHKGRKTLLLAMADPLNVAAIDEVAFTTDMTVRPAIAQISSVRAAVRRFYYNQRIEIPPLDFSPPRSGSPKAADSLNVPDTMTITVGGTEREVIVDEDDQGVIDLTKEVEAAESSATGGQRQPYPPYAIPFADPFFAGAQPTQSYFQGQPTGAYMMAVAQPNPTPPPPPMNLQSTIQSISPAATPTEELEKKFWALMRIMARKGLITREEFLAELSRE